MCYFIFSILFVSVLLEGEALREAPRPRGPFWEGPEGKEQVMCRGRERALKAGQGPGLVLGGTRHRGHQGIVEFLVGVSAWAMLPPSGTASGQTPEQGPSSTPCQSHRVLSAPEGIAGQDGGPRFQAPAPFENRTSP